MTTVTAANDIDRFYNVSSDAIKSSLSNLYGGTKTTGEEGEENLFGSIFNAAVSNINETNELLSDKENEVLKWSMGISENTHDLTIAAGKASTAMSYVIGMRDKLLEAYREIMQIQI